MTNDTKIVSILEESSFQEHKIKTFDIIDKYQHFNKNKAQNMTDCGRSLQFGVYENVQTSLQQNKLEKMFTCKDRFCPFCAWRRARKIGLQSYKVLKAIEEEKKIRYIFVTFTVKNCLIEDLSDTIKVMIKAFNKMSKWDCFKDSVLGWQRALEIPPQKSDNDYIHPHFHTLICVPTSYFNTKYDLYKTQKDWQKMWKKALGVNYDPSVDVRIIKSKNGDDPIAKAVAETVKYPLKSNDLKEMSVDKFEELTKQMFRKRSLAFGGIIKDYRKKLVLDDAEQGDLIYDDLENKALWKKLKTLIYNFRNDSLGYSYYLDKEEVYTVEQEIEEKEQKIAKEENKRIRNRPKPNKELENVKKVVKVIDVVIDDKAFKMRNNELYEVVKKPYQMGDRELFIYFHALDKNTVDMNHYNYTKKLLEVRNI